MKDLDLMDQQLSLFETGIILSAPLHGETCWEVSRINYRRNSMR